VKTLGGGCTGATEEEVATGATEEEVATGNEETGNRRASWL